uniref:Uncharacterized protein n=1 Tax=Rhizophora mucronata TaxID=61149 RepID=A0A2P2NL76_RHIMU
MVRRIVAISIFYRTKPSSGCQRQRW